MPDAFDFQIGVATGDITPPLGVRLAGYGSRKTGADSLGHPLRAEALACSGADGRGWILVTSDTVGYLDDLVARVRAAIGEATGLAPEQIMISATHTHSGPAAMRTYGSDRSEAERQYCEQLERTLADVAADAWNAREPGRFEVAWTEAPQLAHNRRVVGDDGRCTNEWEDHEGRHVGQWDPAVMLVGVRRPGGRLAALLVNFGCHPVVLGPRSMAISSDYVGYLKDKLESDRIAPTVLFALAGAGNVNPRTCIQVGSRHPIRMGEQLAEIVCEAVDHLRPLGDGGAAVARRSWRFVSRRAWREGYHRTQGAEIETEIQALRAGDLALVGLPGELFTEYAAMIRAASPVPQTVIVSIANDSVGYLPIDAALSQGGHEVNHRAGDDLEQPLVETAAAALRDVAG
jgi:hypothetical protein